MRRATRWTYLRFQLIRGMRRLEILVAPLLGWLVAAVIIAVGWTILLLIGLILSPPAFVLWWKHRRRRMTMPLPAKDLLFVRGTTPRRVIRNLEKDPRFSAVVLHEDEW